MTRGVIGAACRCLPDDGMLGLHPKPVTLLAAWTAANLEDLRRYQRLAIDHRRPVSSSSISILMRRAKVLADRRGDAPARGGWAQALRSD